MYNSLKIIVLESLHIRCEISVNSRAEGFYYEVTGIPAKVVEEAIVGYLKHLSKFTLLLYLEI